jgi:hypothetical protein
MEQQKALLSLPQRNIRFTVVIRSSSARRDLVRGFHGVKTVEPLTVESAIKWETGNLPKSVQAYFDGPVICNI